MQLFYVYMVVYIVMYTWSYLIVIVALSLVERALTCKNHILDDIFIDIAI